jgi:hypothetical protein
MLAMTELSIYHNRCEDASHGYFGVGIIWRFCVKMGWLNFGMLKLALCIEGVFYFSVLHQRCVLFWLNTQY